MPAPTTKIQASINGFPVDAFISESHAYEADISDDPAEAGGSTTDDIITKPFMLDVEGLISDAPIGAIALRRALSGSDVPSADALKSLLVDFFGRSTVIVDTSIQSYSSMALQKLTIPKDKTTGAALRFKATFKQILIVTNNRTSVRVASPSGASRVDAGTQTPFVFPLADVNEVIGSGLDKLSESMRRFPKGSPQRRIADLAGFGDTLKGQTGQSLLRP